MNRRRFLTSVGAAAVTAVVGKQQEQEQSGPDRCVAIDSDTAPFSVPSDDADFVVSGEQDVDVFWRDQQFFNELGYVTAQAIARVGGLTIILNEDKQAFIDDYILLHELAHCRGYHHGDGGIVDTNTAWFATGDKTGGKLAESTEEVGNSFDAYDIYSEWDVETLGELGGEFAGGDLLVTELGTAGQRFASDSDDEDLHIKHSHEGFGGEYDAGPQPESDNVYAGQFYKAD